MAHIYKIINKINGKIYIGSSRNIKNRWNQHKWQLRSNKHTNKHLQCAWNKDGEESFDFVIIEECDEEFQFDREQFYIDLLNPFSPNGYNMSHKAGIGLMCEKEYRGENLSGENHPLSKLTNEQVIEIKKMLSEGETIKCVSKKTNINYGIIARIATLGRWVDIGSEYNESISKLKRGKWTDDMKDDLLKLRDEEGLTFKEISKILGLHYSALMKRYRDLKGINKYKNCECCGKKIKIKEKAYSQKYCKECAKDKNREHTRKSMKKLRSEKTGGDYHTK